MPGPDIADRYHYSAGWGKAAQCYTATCAEFLGLTAQSDTAEHAIALLKSTVQTIVRGMLEEGDTPPEPLPDVFIDPT